MYLIFLLVEASVPSGDTFLHGQVQGNGWCTLLTSHVCFHFSVILSLELLCLDKNEFIQVWKVISLVEIKKRIFAFMYTGRNQPKLLCAVLAPLCRSC